MRFSLYLKKKEPIRFALSMIERPITSLKNNQFEPPCKQAVLGEAVRHLDWQIILICFLYKYWLLASLWRYMFSKHIFGTKCLIWCKSSWWFRRMCRNNLSWLVYSTKMNLSVFINNMTAVAFGFHPTYR